MQPLKIIVVDDFEPIREVVCSILREDGRFEVIAQLSDGAQAVEYAQRLQPDLILLDISLPSLNGIEAARQIAVSTPRARVLFVSENNDKYVVRSALEAGARGYILKSELDDDLFPALTAIIRGKTFVGNRLGSA
jgi:two-component system, NarL family, response regulator NreC